MHTMKMMIRNIFQIVSTMFVANCPFIGNTNVQLCLFIHCILYVKIFNKSIMFQTNQLSCQNGRVIKIITSNQIIFLDM